jgi:hypothetical protein
VRAHLQRLPTTVLRIFVRLYFAKSLHFVPLQFVHSFVAFYSKIANCSLDGPKSKEALKTDKVRPGGEGRVPE